MNAAALAIDLDGTLLVGEEVPEANVKAILAAVDAGLRVVIATARWSQFAVRLGAGLGVTDPVIACSGAQVFDPAGPGDVYDQRLPAEFAEALFHICNEERCIATITLADHVEIKMDGRPQARHLPAEMRWTKSLRLDRGNLPRVAAIQGSACGERIQSELGAAFGEKVNILDSIGPNGKVILAITSREATKGAALEAACAHMGIEPGQVVAFGDAENDLDMFAIAGASVAMGQADDATKAAATFVSTPNTEGGVAHAIWRLLEGETLIH